MTQRAGLHQIKRTDINRKSFLEQYTQLEKNSAHQREPVQSAGDLPMMGNLPGSLCLVLDENTMYSWDQGLQNWKPVLGRSFEIKSNMRRSKRKYVATEGQTIFPLDFMYQTGEDALDVYVQGMLQDVNQDYEETDERTITFRSPLPKDVIVTVATPMVVEGTYTVTAIEKRLKELEHNSYQLMMGQYYTGKPVDVRGLVFDGFINTNYIDFTKTSLNMKYDGILRTMQMNGEMMTNFYETFDNNKEIDISSTTLLSNSEITLPIKTVFESVFSDDFSTRDKIDEKNTDAYHDIERQYITTVDTLAGANHYYKGDFMNTTGDVDRSGWAGGLGVYGSDSSQRLVPGDGHTEFEVRSVFPMRDKIGVTTNRISLYMNKFPYDSDYTGYMYAAGQYRSNWITDSNVNLSLDYYNGKYWYAYPFFLNKEGPRFNDTMVYVKSTDRIYSLYQYHEGSNKYYQRLCMAPARQDVSWSWQNRPKGLPSTLMGDETTDYSKSIDYIDQVAATEQHILIRSKDKVYFIDSAMHEVVKVLDWSNATRKPSLYNQYSKQFAADAKYLYFPLVTTRDSKKGYFVEVFDRETGEFVQELTVSMESSVQYMTTAMHYDFHENRMILGMTRNYWITPVGKSVNSYSVDLKRAGFISFQPPNKDERYVQSKTFKTNLPVFNYKLIPDEQLNSGLIDYYIRIDSSVWNKITPNTEYVFTNPNGAKEVDVQLRAVLRITNKSLTSPILTGWVLQAKPFEPIAVYQSKVKNMSLTDIVGGRLVSTQSTGIQSSLQWSISYGKDTPSVIITQAGEFALPAGMDEGDISIRAEMGTSDKLISPVVKDVQIQLYKVAEGVLESMVFEQLEDIKDATMWVTTGSSHEYYRVYASRDGGKIWEPGKRNNVVKNNDGKVEVEWLLPFKLDSEERRKLKLKFEMDGVTEIYQYGAVISPV